MSHYIKVPLERAQTPKQGYRVYLNKWWLVEDGCVLGFKLHDRDHPTPQCNDNKAIIEVSLKRKPEQTAVFLAVAYWPSQE